MKRNSNKRIFINNHELYEQKLKKKNLKFIRQFTTPILRHPTNAQRSRIEQVAHVWSVGDRFYKLASIHYGDPTLWWVIAHFNQRPTEAHVKIGDTIVVPIPLSEALKIMRA